MAGIVIVAALLLATWAVLWPRTRIAVSLTNSLPHKIYLIHVGRLPGRGELVAFVPPRNPFYPARGGFIKRVRGVAGDIVSRNGRSFEINGDAIGEAKTFSRDGRPLAPGPVGILPPRHYFVWAPNRDSFDSRYEDIGWIAEERVVGVAEGLL